MERKIGEKFTINGKTYVVKEGAGCADCAFYDTDLCNDKWDVRGICLKNNRYDGKGVIFKEVIEETSKISNMKDFNINLAKQGNLVCTRDGHKVRIICFDKADEELPIVALVKREDGTEAIANYDVNGYYYGIHEDDDDNNDYDLIMASEKKTMWVNIYKNGGNGDGRCSGGRMYESIEDAKVSDCVNSSDYITTVKVEWEE